MAKIIYLYISSYIGMSLGATHFYGELIDTTEGEYKHVDLAKTLSQKDVTRLRKKGYYVLRGDRFLGFDSKDEIITLARSTYKDIFPGASVLILGNPAYAEPKPILDGTPEIVQLANNLSQDADLIGRWQGDKKKMMQICKKWDMLLDSIAQDK